MSDEQNDYREVSEEGRGKLPGLFESVLVVAGIATVITICILMLGLDAHIPIFVCILGVVVLGLRLGNKWNRIEEGYVSAVNATTSAFFILMMVGIMIGVWMTSGVISTMIDYGLAILSPKTFLIASFLICSVVSISTGSSWGTVASIGVALVGVGAGLGIPVGMTGGAIISGSYFGDKMSPLSDTTNLAPAVAGATLYDHIGAMVWTTGTSFLIAGAAFAFLSFTQSTGSYDPSRVLSIREALASIHTISPLLLLPPIVVILTAVKKIPAIPGMMLGIVTGALCGFFVQGVSFSDMLTAANYGFSSSVSAEVFGEETASLVNGLLNRGGLQNMMWTVSLAWMAIGFGGMLEVIGYLHVILNAVVKSLRNVGSLVTATVVACIGVNVLIGDQYLAILLPGRLFKAAYDDFDLEPKMLSRTLEDSATLTSSLVPWNECGAYMAATLGIPTLVYAPWAILNWINPLVACTFAFLGIKVFYKKKEATAA